MADKLVLVVTVCDETQRQLKTSTCPHGALPRQSQESFLLEDKTAPDEDAGADGQRQTHVEVVLASVLAHGEGGCVVVLRHIEQLAVQTLTKNTAVGANPGTFGGEGTQTKSHQPAAQSQQQPSHNDLPSTQVILWAGKP